jgi:hypothetical protein
VVVPYDYDGALGYYPYDEPPPVLEAPPENAVPPGQESGYWYYCTTSGGYYPFVPSCPGGWLKVVPH